jgi:hypothetical protein
MARAWSRGTGFVAFVGAVGLAEEVVEALAGFNLDASTALEGGDVEGVFGER